MCNIFNIFSSMLFFMMIFFPMTYQIPKIIIMAFLSIGMLIKLVSRSVHISKNVYIWYLAFIIYGLLWGYYGLIKGNPGSMDFIRLNAIWVIVYFIFTVFIDNRIFNNLLNTIVYSSLIVSVYNILCVLDSLGWIPFNLYEILDTGTRIGIHPGYIQITSHNIASLTYTVPFVIVVYIMMSSKYKFNISKKVVFLTMIMSIITVLLSGRRSLMLVTMCTPILIIPISYILNISTKVNRGLRKYMIVMLVLIIIPSIYVLSNLSTDSIRLYMERFFGAFNSSEQVERVGQFASLIDGFKKYPIIGSGPGIGVDFVRNAERPWIYELSYIQQLYNTGIVGVIVYIILIAYMYIKAFIITRKEKKYVTFFVPIIIGMTSFLIANATNPYLGKYDHMWTIFLTIIFINISTIEMRSESSG